MTNNTAGDGLTRHTARYLAYCRSNANPADTQHDIDRHRFPGGSGAGYLIWIDQMWRRWEQGPGHPGPHSVADHARFDRWLTTHTTATAPGVAA